MKNVTTFHIIDVLIISITTNYDGSFYLIRQMECIMCNLSVNRGLCVLAKPNEYGFPDNMPHDYC